MQESTMTQAQALNRVEQLVHETAEAITPHPRLELIPYSVATSSCLDHGVVINRKYWLRDVPKAENMSVSRQVRAFWQAGGHTIVASGDDGNPGLSGLSRPDNFILALVWAEGDDLYLAATSPCVTR
ncbi:hypothetical protein ACIBG8_39185 [Nonomuraea sp. NPDC050556]|uniref:hypothetical protein n=1 Tax=Nonomuraea sp. NPDC050556 TaxID=3364369 RepID=UPI00379423CB